MVCSGDRVGVKPAARAIGLLDPRLDSPPSLCGLVRQGVSRQGTWSHKREATVFPRLSRHRIVL